MDLEINDMNKNIIDDLLQYGERVTLEYKNALPQILVQDIKDLPLPKVSDEQLVFIVKRVDKILAAKKEYPQADTKELEKEIDKFVYELMG
jgi:hypothetical protein